MKPLKPKYRLPIFGEVDIFLRKESASVYKFLERNNEIRRLINLDQLGVLRRRFSCAHHSKYEYCIMIIYLIELVHQEFKFLYPLSGSIKKKKKKRKIIISSIAELLKCWALLLPIGHLHGTFAFEKAFLKFLFHNPAKKDNFLKNFKCLKKVYKQIEDIIETGDYYRIHQAFAILKLLKQSNSENDRDIIDNAIQYLSFYLDPNTKLLRRAREVFSILRQIAYVLLDSHYSNLLFSFSNPQITLDTIGSTLRKKDEN